MSTLAPPSGFVEHHRDKALWWLKVGWESLLQDVVPQNLPAYSPYSSSITHHPSLAIPGGRGTIQRIEINSQTAIIVRPYRRGGFIRHFTCELYWDYPPRPFVELSCTEEIRRRGVPTVEVLGARIEPTVIGLYRGLLITREATGFQDLWSWLQTEKSIDLRRQTLTAVAQVIADMHNAGVEHADLNPTNILVSPTTDPPQVMLIDFDRVRLFSRPVPVYRREASLYRFQRFFAKHDVHQKRLSPGDFEHFCQM